MRKKILFFVTVATEMQDVHVKSEYLIPLARQMTVILQMLDSKEGKRYYHPDLTEIRPALLRNIACDSYFHRQIHHCWKQLEMPPFTNIFSTVCSVPKKKHCPVFFSPQNLLRIDEKII